MIRYFLVLVLALGGCSWIESDAGKARYVYRVTTPDGVKHEIDLFNAKDIGLVSARATRLDDGTIEVELIEQGVSAAGPMATMAEANARLVDAVLGVAP